MLVKQRAFYILEMQNPFGGNWVSFFFLKDVRAQNFPHTDFVKTLTAGRE